MGTVISIVFWLAIGLLYLGFTFRYQEVLIGLCAVAIGIVQIIALLKQR